MAHVCCHSISLLTLPNLSARGNQKSDAEIAFSAYSSRADQSGLIISSSVLQSPLNCQGVTPRAVINSHNSDRRAGVKAHWGLQTSKGGFGVSISQPDRDKRTINKYQNKKVNKRMQCCYHKSINFVKLKNT